VNTLRQVLNRIDGKGYKAYKDITGSYTFPKYQLMIDYVQGDPFASPSKIRIIVPRERTVLTAERANNKARQIRCEDFITRSVHTQLHRETRNGKKGSGKSGLLTIDNPGQEVIERSAVQLSSSHITICLSIGLPAQGRRILSKEAITLFFDRLPVLIERAVYNVDCNRLDDALLLCDQQQAIRHYMEENQLISFIANGSILPRESGVSNKPLQDNRAVPFKSAPSSEVSIPIPGRGEPIKGMGIRQGITLIVGGGYHGKSTLLQAIERGVYDHCKQDGREYVLTNIHAVKVRAEDGRQVTNVNISPFINDLPFGKNTYAFSTENASGSTSQAANIIEAIEAGASTLLIDEDTSATNFMIRDKRMQTLVAKEKEPITPFIDKVKQLYDDLGVSTILVMGGSGDYFDVADYVIMMEQYVPYDVTDRAKYIASTITYERDKEGGSKFGEITHRKVSSNSLNSMIGRKQKVNVKSKNLIIYGSTNIQLDDVEQLVDESQTRMIAEIFRYVEKKKVLSKQVTIHSLLKRIQEQIDENGLSSFAPFPNQHPGELARPRSIELAAALNRLRTLKINE
jgi:predicted ABC-class ATPase